MTAAYMTPEQLAEGKRLADATPSGAWAARETYVYRTSDPRDHRQMARVPSAVTRSGDVHPIAAFIAASRTLVPAMLAHIAALTAESQHARGNYLAVADALLPESAGAEQLVDEAHRLRQRLAALTAERDAMRAACVLVVQAFDRDDSLDFDHYPYDLTRTDGSIVQYDCPEDDTCECIGPRAVNACGAALALDPIVTPETP